MRSVAAETGISKSSDQRYFQLFGLPPHRTEGFKLSNDAFFVEELRDVVGQYLSPTFTPWAPCDEGAKAVLSAPLRGRG